MTSTTWHQEALDRLSEILVSDPSVKAMVLTGSLASDGALVDQWSDIDTHIVLEDARMSHYYLTTDWLKPLGKVIAHGTVSQGTSKVLRVCLRPFRRLDLSFVPESTASQPHGRASPLLPGDGKVLWSRLGEMPPATAAASGVNDAEAWREVQLARMAEEFWLRLSLVIAKAARNDLLVAAHLALELSRDCLVLQMMLRDRHLGTTVHREGGWGNDIIGQVATADMNGGAVGVLQFADRCGGLFDELAVQLSGTYSPRHGDFAGTIAEAACYCSRRV